MRRRTVHKVPKEKRGTDNLSFVTGLPWKHSKNHEAGDEVVLDATHLEPSFHPTRTVLPPTTPWEPGVRGMYVKTNNLDPRGGGIGFTEGCPGCNALITGSIRTEHNGDCRLRVMEKISRRTS